jgi:molecular chaperone HtpG
MGKRKFKTEVQQLLDLVIHSLYSHKEIFLRELISNASDAIDRRRFEGLQDKAIASEEGGRIQIIPDKTLNTLTVRDNGIGMSAEEVEKNIGTIASSGTRAFMDELRKGKSTDNAELIGQFGVGFYASFMVADKVEVYTRRAGAPAGEGVHWVSKGDGSYTIDECQREQAGTDVIIHLRELEETEGEDGETDRVDYGEYLEEWKIKKVVKQYSDFVDYPIVMDITREERPRDENGDIIEGVDPIVTTKEETLNSMKAIWTRPKSEVTEEQYSEFYRHITHAYDEPLDTIHFSVEGIVQFSALLYLPTKAPFDLYMPEQGRRGLHLYVKRVYIMDDCKDLLPDYMRFVRGVVQCNDLPLNVSREILQENAVVRRIHKSLTGKVLGALKTLKEKEREKYEVWYNEFGKVLKEGLHNDFTNKEKLQDLVLFESSTTEPRTLSSLREYVERMPEDQEAIASRDLPREGLRGPLPHRPHRRMGGTEPHPLRREVADRHRSR